MVAHRYEEQATYEYDFEDNEFSLFMLYDCKGTTKFWGENPENFDYSK